MLNTILILVLNTYFIILMVSYYSGIYSSTFEPGAGMT